MANQIVYCSWDGQPALLVRQADGRVEGWTYLGDGRWRSGDDADIATKAAVLGERQFRETFKDVALPRHLT